MPGRANPYEIGAMDEEELSSFLVTPQDILDKMNEIKVEADTVNTIVSTSPKVSDAFRVAWQSWYKDVWQAFYDGHTGFSGWFSRLGSTAMDEAELHQTKVRQWRALLEKETGNKLPGPGLSAPDTIPWKWILYAGIGIGAIVAVGYTAGSLTGLIKD